MMARAGIDATDAKDKITAFENKVGSLEAAFGVLKDRIALDTLPALNSMQSVAKVQRDVNSEITRQLMPNLR